MERSNERTYGEIKEVFHDGITAKFEWTFENYCLRRVCTYMSPTVKYFNMIWHLQVWKHFEAFLLTLHRKRETSGDLEAVGFNYREADGGEADIAHVSWRRRILLAEATSWAELTITCTLWEGDSPHAEVVPRVTQRKDAPCTGGRIDELLLKGVCSAKQTEDASCTNSRMNEDHSEGLSSATQTEDASCTNSRMNEDHSEGVSRATQTEDASCANSRMSEDHSEDMSILSRHFENLLLSGDDHDFLIKVKDEQFGAHKCVLRARSPVFAAMFRSKMAESADDSVTIDDCDPAAFGEFLRYVYTGKVVISSAGHALGLYHAGDKYDFPRLKEICVEFLKNSLAATTISDVINLAGRHDEGVLLQRALVYLATHLEEVMLTVEWQRFLTGNPIQANEMCIKALQSLKKC